jgi:hypothetical protein
MYRRHYMLDGKPVFLGDPVPVAPPAPLQAVPRDQWPIGFKFIGSFAKVPPDKGVGDTAKRLLGEKGEWFKREMKKHGIDCGCSARQIEWNLKYPYPI